MVNVSTSVLRTYREQNVHIQKNQTMNITSGIQIRLNHNAYVQVYVMML
jgi:hypothetical protein